MGRVVQSLLLPSLLIAVASCSSHSGQSTKMAVETSLGRLVLFEKLGKVGTDASPLEAGPDDLLVAIHFEGKTRIPIGEQGIAIVDPSGTRFLPVAMGSPTQDGRVSEKGWRMNGATTGRGGRWIFVGEVETPEPKQVFVYRIPKQTAALAFVDGDRLHPLMGERFSVRIEPVPSPRETKAPDDEGATSDAGLPGGVEGGVPGGVAGGVVGDLPVTPPRAVRPYRVGAEVPAPQILKHVPPTYPDQARDARVQGVVILECTVGPSGKVTDARVLRGIPLLNQAAVDVVKQWVYAPTLLHGTRVPVIMTVTVSFRLDTDRPEPTRE